MRAESRIRRKYEELAHLKTLLVKQRETMSPESFNLRIQDVNSKMSTIDWLFGEVKDI